MSDIENGIRSLLDEVNSLRAANAALGRERDALAKEVAHLRTAMARDDGPQYLANLLTEAEAALLSAAQQRGKAERERDALREEVSLWRQGYNTGRYEDALNFHAPWKGASHE